MMNGMRKNVRKNVGRRRKNYRSGKDGESLGVSTEKVSYGKGSEKWSPDRHTCVLSIVVCIVSCDSHGGAVTNVDESSIYDLIYI